MYGTERESAATEEVAPAVEAVVGGQPAPVELLRAPGAGARSAALMRHLQQTHGNRAVVRHLARDPTATTPDPAAQYSSALQARNWERAAALLSGFDDKGIAERVGTLSDDDAMGMMLASSISTDPNLAKIRTPLQGRLDALRDARLRDQLGPAIAADNMSQAVDLLFQMSPRSRVIALKPYGQTVLDPLVAEARRSAPYFADLLYRTTRFAQFGPADHTIDSQFTYVTQGDLEHEANVGGGHVRVNTGPTIQAIGHGNRRIGQGYTMDYQGPEALRTRWLQFIWREIVVQHPRRGSYKVHAPITTSGGHYDLTTDPAQPSYNTDALPGAPTPFYEESGGHNRTAEGTTMWDHPSAADDFVQREFNAGATTVTSRANFNTWLIRDMDVLYRVQLTVEWNYTNRHEPDRVQSVVAAGPAAVLEPRMRARLIEQFPHFDYLP
jgi:hypothetical protein